MISQAGRTLSVRRLCLAPAPAMMITAALVPVLVPVLALALVPVLALVLVLVLVLVLALVLRWPVRRSRRTRSMTGRRATGCCGRCKARLACTPGEARSGSSPPLCELVPLPVRSDNMPCLPACPVRLR